MRVHMEPSKRKSVRLACMHWLQQTARSLVNAMHSSAKTHSNYPHHNGLAVNLALSAAYTRTALTFLRTPLEAATQRVQASAIHLLPFRAAGESMAVGGPKRLKVLTCDFVFICNVNIRAGGSAERALP